MVIRDAAACGRPLPSSGPATPLHVEALNPFGLVATAAAFREGELRGSPPCSATCWGNQRAPAGSASPAATCRA
ncbi:MAG: hypothetical protein MZV49_00205 [Rhodopseudomonas palustris]|nr:hypothetical protein [Rhodopseudomonas palustris]